MHAEHGKQASVSPLRQGLKLTDESRPAGQGGPGMLCPVLEMASTHLVQFCLVGPGNRTQILLFPQLALYKLIFSQPPKWSL